jgi:hypothetical protein
MSLPIVHDPDVIKLAVGSGPFGELGAQSNLLGWLKRIAGICPKDFTAFASDHGNPPAERSRRQYR